jgi:hypothetical protein
MAGSHEAEGVDMSEQEDSPERRPDPVDEDEEQSLWDVYLDRFRRQQVDDPVEDRREGRWDRFKRQQVNDPVTRRRPR